MTDRLEGCSTTRPIRGRPHDTRAWALSLVGHSVPSLKFIDARSGAVDLGALALDGLVLYVQPGLIVPPGDDRRLLQEDALQHDSYLALRSRFAQVIPGGTIAALAVAPDYGHFNTSGEWMRSETPDGLAVSHHVLCDPARLLAQELELPTFQRHVFSYYRRTTLIANDGRIGKVFHPAIPGRDAEQALTWLQLH